jgi:hypothetical protein
MAVLLPYGNNLPGHLGEGATSFTGAISTLSASSQYIAGFLDGSERARLFDASVALPQLSVAPVQITDPQGNSTGGYYLQLTYASGSLDAGSPAQFLLDQYAIVLVAGTSTG